MEDIITVEELAKACAAQIKAGNGKKKILLADDDEGNGYHSMYFLFTPAKECLGGEYPPNAPRDAEKNPDKYIILG